ncbi:N-acetylmuramoyl-L-alanine amidase [Falsihalocynthiibacter arcticus]|uniref:N-acetylmuramoyl-L-alanine amidase n=1 Tax=Falsihalocynthiibacter arcticus TaxID=1579316 RepID=UPI00300144B9
MRGIFATLCALSFAGAIHAQEFNALARVDVEKSGIIDTEDGLKVDLLLSQPVPYRVFTLTDPARLVIDFNEVDWSGVEAEDLLLDTQVQAVHMGPFSAGWSRMVVDLKSPQVIDLAGLKIGETRDALFTALLKNATPEAFAAASGAPAGAAFSVPKAVDLATPIRRQTGEGDVMIVLDPGHGGIDPGAERGDVREADLMLTFALELKEVLLREGGFQVQLTREDDTFVPLETRVTMARAVRADVFLSLHADALSEGRATGATVYTLSDTASDEASQKLAERHDRADLLAGVDLSQQDDVIANILMELARTETSPRADRLADDLVIGLREHLGTMYKKPRLEAGFSVLKAPDIPSVLVELGFISNPKDLDRLQDPEWRKKAQLGILQALQNWTVTDAAEARLLRQ